MDSSSGVQAESLAVDEVGLPEKSAESAASVVSLSPRHASLHQRLDAAIKAKAGSLSPQRNPNKTGQKTGIPSWSPSPKPILTRPPSATSLSSAEAERVDVKTLIQRHTMRQDSFTPPQSPSIARVAPKGMVKATVTTCPSPASATSGQAIAPRNSKTVIIRAVAKSTSVNRHTPSSLLNSSPAIVVASTGAKSMDDQCPAPSTARRNMVIHLSARAEAADMSSLRGSSNADVEMEQDVRLAQLEQQHQELGAELAIRGQDCARLEASTQEIYGRVACLEAATRSGQAESGSVTSKLASSADALRSLVWGSSRSPSPTKPAPLIAEAAGQEDLQEMRNMIKVLKEKQASSPGRAESQAKDLLQMRSCLDDMSNRMSNLELELVTARKVMSLSPGSVLTNPFCLSQKGAAVPYTLDEDRLQEREAMIAAREVRVLDMQRRLVDMEAGRVAAEGALKDAAALQLRVAALEKELGVSRGTRGADKVNSMTAPAKNNRVLLRLQRLFCIRP